MDNRTERRLAAKENAKAPAILTRVPEVEWPPAPMNLQEVWRSRDFLAQLFEENGLERISVCRVQRRQGQWLENITWEELMQVKREIGRGDRDAVEVYPADADIVNVANMRHLWLMPEPLTFAWRKS